MNQNLEKRLKGCKDLGLYKIKNCNDNLDHLNISIQTSLFPNLKTLVIRKKIENFDFDPANIKILKKFNYTNLHKSFDDIEAMIIQDRDRLFELAEKGELGFKIIDEFLKLAERNK